MSILFCGPVEYRSPIVKLYNIKDVIDNNETSYIKIRNTFNNLYDLKCDIGTYITNYRDFLFQNHDNKQIIDMNHFFQLWNLYIEKIDIIERNLRGKRSTQIIKRSINCFCDAITTKKKKIFDLLVDECNDDDQLIYYLGIILEILRKTRSMKIASVIEKIINKEGMYIKICKLLHITLKNINKCDNIEEKTIHLKMLNIYTSTLNRFSDSTFDISFLKYLQSRITDRKYDCLAMEKYVQAFIGYKYSKTIEDVVISRKIHTDHVYPIIMNTRNWILSNYDIPDIVIPDEIKIFDEQIKNTYCKNHKNQIIMNPLYGKCTIRYRLNYRKIYLECSMLQTFFLLMFNKQEKVTLEEFSSTHNIPINLSRNIIDSMINSGILIDYDEYIMVNDKYQGKTHVNLTEYYVSLFDK
jgi:hypothetical protein